MALIKLHSTQEIVASDTTRFRVVNCGRRWGKTTLAIEELTGKLISKSDTICAYIAPTYGQARDIAWRDLKKRLEPVIESVNESRLEIKVRTVDGGISMVMLRGWESVETLRGQKFHFLVIDEVAMLRSFWENWQEVLRPTLTDYKGEVLFISTPKGKNHFYDLYNLAEKEENYKSFRFSSYDNPFIDNDEIDDAKKEMTEDRFAQEYLADFRKAEGLVYKEFDRDEHVVEKVEGTFNKTIGAIDFGYTNPAAILEIQEYIRGGDFVYFVRSEFYKRQQKNEQLVQHMRVVKPVHVYPDPAEPDRIKEFEDAGFSVMSVSKDIAAGIDSVRTFMKNNQLYVHPDCVSLISELETYSYPKNKDGQNEKEVPEKFNDHAVDALRYALHNHYAVKDLSHYEEHLAGIEDYDPYSPI